MDELKRGMERQDIIDTWRQHVGEIIGAAEGLQEHLFEFVDELKGQLRFGPPQPLGIEINHLRKYENTVVNMIIALERAERIKGYFESRFPEEDGQDGEEA